MQRKFEIKQIAWNSILEQLSSLHVIYHPTIIWSCLPLAPPMCYQYTLLKKTNKKKRYNLKTHQISKISC